uniref:EGF-like domain-containing protein n=1 Tax=Ciona savignyi TaxID=51511 RepID=H2YHD0_CIOSA
MKTPVIYWKLFVLLVSLGKVYSQTTNNFPLVNVNDSSAGIDVGTQKTYTTRVRLIATTPSSTFVPSVFQNDAVNFYQQTLGGSYAAVTGVVGTSGTSSTGQLIVDVVYNVLYSFTAMQNVGITDNQVTTEIGTYQAVIDGINDFGTTLKNFYVFETDSSVFVFSGSSICSAPGTNCTANTVCNETLSGVTVMCISACKKGYCQNNGTCEQASSATGPTCTCLSTADVWFLGTTCQTRVELWMVIVAAVLGFLLILAAIILACCCYVTKRRKKEKESGLYLTSEKTTTYTNKGYLDTEHGQITKVDAVPR